MLKNFLKYTMLMMLGLFASDLTAKKPTQKTKQSAKSAPLSTSVDIFSKGYSKFLSLAQDAVNEGKKLQNGFKTNPCNLT